MWQFVVVESPEHLKSAPATCELLVVNAAFIATNRIQPGWWTADGRCNTMGNSVSPDIAGDRQTWALSATGEKNAERPDFR